MKAQSNRSIWRLWIIAGMLLSLTACEKEVSINLASSPPRVVVQGGIETNSPPYVILTSTVGFFSKVDLATLENSFLHGAVIQVSDGSRSVTLREYSFDTGTAFKYYVYSIDSGNIMLGENGKTYELKITYEGNTYTSTTKIPNPQGIDSMWFDTPLFAGNNTPDSALQLFVNYTDPDTLGDFVRCFTQRGNQGFFPSTNFSDEIVNGKTINNIGLAAGYQNDIPNRNRDSLIYFFPGERVTLKWCAIDKGVYDFWNTLDFAKGSVGNPFSSPINPTSNIKNGAVGVWAGYGVYARTVVVAR